MIMYLRSQAMMSMADYFALYRAKEIPENDLWFVFGFLVMSIPTAAEAHTVNATVCMLHVLTP